MAPGELTDTGGGFADGAARASAARLDRWIAALARRERALWTLLVLALVADVVSTVLGLRLGHAEGNPVIASVLADAGVLGFFGVKTAVLGAAAGVRLALPQFRVAIPLGLALPWLLAAGLNATLLLATA